MEPFLKWPGGKRWLVSSRPDLFENIQGRYIEPFLGGGAVFFSLEPDQSILSDVNQELISTYKAIRDGWRTVGRFLSRHQTLHCEEHYYKVRSDEPTNRFEAAARFIYLNRTCWNGLYRVNLQGKFNVPIGTKTTVLLPTDDFQHAASLLKRTTLDVADFERTVDRAERGDLVFADPPYVAQENLGMFRKYHTSSFSWDDQVRLQESLVRAKMRGAKVVLLNADVPSLRDLYAGDFNVEVIGVRNTLAASSSRRGRRSEMIALAQGV